MGGDYQLRNSERGGGVIKWPVGIIQQPHLKQTSLGRDICPQAAAAFDVK